MKTKILSTLLLAALLGVQTLKADTIAGWTFQTSASTNNIPGTSATRSGVLADVGTGTGSASHSLATTVWSIPAGNGSTNSWSANMWSAGDYYQFSVSTSGFQDIQLSYDQTSSGTGPGQFNLAYSTDGINFFNVGATRTVLVNGAPNPPWNAATSSSLFTFSDNLTATTVLNNQATVYFRLVDASTVSAAGGTVATGGTDRVDNFFVSATPMAVPEPSTLALVGLGGLYLLTFRRHRK